MISIFYSKLITSEHTRGFGDPTRPKKSPFNAPEQKHGSRDPVLFGRPYPSNDDHWMRGNAVYDLLEEAGTDQDPLLSGNVNAADHGKQHSFIPSGISKLRQARVDRSKSSFSGTACLSLNLSRNTTRGV